MCFWTLEFFKVLIFWYNELTNFKLYVLARFNMFGPAREMNSYLLSMWHLPPIYSFIYLFPKWFGGGLECQVVASKVYSWFLDFNISIIRLIYDLQLVVHLILFDFEARLFYARWFILGLVNLWFKVYFFNRVLFWE